MYVHFYGINVATVISSHSTEGKDSNGKASSKQYCCVDTYMERNGNAVVLAMQ